MNTVLNKEKEEYCVGKKLNNLPNSDWEEITYLGRLNSIRSVLDAKNRYVQELYYDGSGFEGRLNVCKISFDTILPIDETEFSRFERELLLKD